MAERPSVRECVARLLMLPAEIGSQIGIGNDQLTALVRGEAVTLHRDQLRSLNHHTYPDLDTSEHWTLTGDNDLTPAP